MFAVIYQIPARPGVGMIDVAGRPLVERQLQWLRAAGCERVALEVGTEPECGALARFLDENEALRADVSLVLSRRPLGPREIARRAGHSSGAPFIALPADVLGDGDLTLLFRAASSGGALALADPPPLPGVELEAGIVRLIGDRYEHPAVVEGAGWAARVGSPREAMAIGSAALLGRLPCEGGGHVWSIQVHASEVAPGIWLARGARVDPAAEIVAPVLIGPEAVIRAGARVGPDAFIGERAVIEADAWVVGSIVKAGTIVGEGLLLRSCVVSPMGVTELDNGTTAPLEDSLLIGGVRARAAASWASRLIALAALIVVAPAAALVVLARAAIGLPSVEARSAPRRGLERRWHEGVTGFWLADVAPRLFDVVRGTRVLVGVDPALPDAPGISAGLVNDAMEAPWGVINVERALVPEGGDLETRMRGRAWYAHAKSPGIDVGLLLRLAASFVFAPAGGALSKDEAER